MSHESGVESSDSNELSCVTNFGFSVGFESKSSQSKKSSVGLSLS